MTELYDEIGRGYRDYRRPDPRIERVILARLGSASSVVNVGAGAGSYEPRDRPVVAVEPSRTMIDQRPSEAAPAVQATAVALPFHDEAFDASLALLTLHHWPDQRKGLQELRRASRRRVVILTWEPSEPEFWLFDYFPEILELDRPLFPTMEELRRELGPIEVSVVPVPHDCTDGFLGAYWRRPAAYLDPRVRAAISGFSRLRDEVGPGLERLRRDLESGAWQRRCAGVLSQSALDLGYRLVATA